MAMLILTRGVVLFMMAITVAMDVATQVVVVGVATPATATLLALSKAVHIVAKTTVTINILTTMAIITLVVMMLLSMSQRTAFLVR